VTGRAIRTDLAIPEDARLDHFDSLMLKTLDYIPYARPWRDVKDVSDDPAERARFWADDGKYAALLIGSRDASLSPWRGGLSRRLGR